MKKRSIAQIILVTFFKTIGIIIVLIGVGFLSYYLTMLFLKQTAREERSTRYQHVIDVNAGSESSNLIYSFNEKTKSIEAMVLELFDCNTKNLDYITIPANTQITISGGTYKELLEKSGQLPQVVQMSRINEFFPGDVAYEYGILILQEEFRADIGYFTALPSAEFNRCFEREEGSKLIYRPTKALLDETAKCGDEDELNDWIAQKWDKLISDITLSQKQHYSGDLRQVKRELIRTHGAYGSETSGVFHLKKKKNRAFVNAIWEKKAYEFPQAKGTSDAAKLSLYIYNGSKITGLAARYREKLEAEGFTVKGVGNATGGTRAKTMIYAKKKKNAETVAKYFKGAGIDQVSDLSSGADVEIILGTGDNLS